MYKVQKNKSGKFEIYEIATEHVLDEFSSYQDARKYYKQLKSGVGFYGFTPSFFNIRFNVKGI